MKHAFLFAALLIAISLCAAGEPAAQTANAPAADAFVRDFYNAYKMKDTARLARFYAPDATFSDPTFELDLKGPDQIREVLTNALAKYESLDFQNLHITPAGNDLVVEGAMIGKLSGKSVRVPFVSIFHFRNQKIASQRDMFDVTHFLVQLGVIPPPFGPKPSATSSPAVNNGGTTVFMVRHAEKVEGSGDNPDLSDVGRARAERLAKILKDADITAIYATEFKRTQQTAGPLAQMLGLRITIVPAKDFAGLIAKLRETKGNALVVGHGNTIPDVSKGIGIATPVNISESDYDNLFVLELGEKARLTRLHYP